MGYGAFQQGGEAKGRGKRQGLREGVPWKNGDSRAEAGQGNRSDQLDPVHYGLHIFKCGHIGYSGGAYHVQRLGKPVAYPFRLVGIGACGHVFAPQLTVAAQYVKAPWGVVAPGGGVDLKGLAAAYKLPEYFIEYLRCQGVTHGALGIRAVLGAEVVVAHYGKIRYPDAFEVFFNIGKVGLLPAPALEIFGIVGVHAVYYVYRAYDEVDMAQMSLFDTVKDDDVLEELKSIDVGNLTPIDALNTIYRLQNKLKNRW